MKTQTILFALISVGFIFSSVLAFHYHGEIARPEAARLPSPPQPQPRPASVLPVLLPATEEDREDGAVRIQELEAELAQRDEMIRNMRSQIRQIPMSTEQIAAVAPPERGDWLENLRESDPERFEQIQARRADMRQRVQDSFARKAAHFLYRDTTSLSDIEQEEHDLMLARLETTWRLAQQVQDDRLSWEERRPIRSELMEQVAELRPLLESVRDRELYELGRQLGYDESGAAQFVNYINDMQEVTSFSNIFWGGRGMGMRGP